MSKVLFLVNHEVVIYNFRLELVEQLLEDGHEVYISSPYGPKIEKLIELGCRHIETDISRHGTNPIKELKLIVDYIKLLNVVKPDIVFSYTIKPNIYGGIACSIKKIPYVANVTGLGIAIENGGIMRKITLLLYRFGLRKAKKVFFQNSANQEFMLKKRVVSVSNEVLPGSGVNLTKHCYERYPTRKDNIIFLIIGRLMYDKGTDEVFRAARVIKQEFPIVIFRFIGFYDEDYEEKTEKAVAEGIIEYVGNQDDVHKFIKESHVTLHASHHEGMANVLLETAACGRPVIATDVPGCRETYDDGISGISFEVQNSDDMIRAIRLFLSLPYEKWEEMGRAGREKMEKEFDRNYIVNKYIDILPKQKLKNEKGNDLNVTL